MKSPYLDNYIAADTHNPTQIETPTANSLLVSEQAGRIWWYWDDNGDGFYERRRLYDTGYSEVVGLLYDPLDGAVWIGGRGPSCGAPWIATATVWQMSQSCAWMACPGAATRTTAWNGIRSRTPSAASQPIPGFTLAWGPRAIWTVATISTRPFCASPVRARARLDLQIVSRGNRNAYDVVWAPVDMGSETHWSLFASENGPDFNDAPDEVNHIRWGLDYGFPDQFGLTSDPAQTVPNTGPVAELPGHASADGLTFVTAADWPADYRTLYVSLFGEIFGSERVGHTVERIALSPLPGAEPLTVNGETSPFIEGLERPLAMTTDVQGQLLVAHYVTGIVYRVRYVGP